jgi:hypothetical protein
MKYILLCVLIGAGFAGHAEFSEKYFTTEQLQGTANYLGLRIQKPKTKILACDPDAATAKTWMGGELHSLIDAKIKAEANHFQNNPSQMLKRAAGCHKACACSLYSDMLSASEDSMGKNPNYKKLKKILATESKKQDPVACAKKLSWFCGSELESALRGTAPDTLPSSHSSEPARPGGQNNSEE